MDSHAPNSMELNFKQRPGAAKSTWNWRSTGLFYPETEDWALSRPGDAAETSGPPAADASQLSGPQRRG